MLGVDPGTAITGYGVVEPLPGRPGRLVECGVLRTRAAGDSPERLRVLDAASEQLAARQRTDAVAAEGLFDASSPRAAVVLGHARGVILLAAARAGVPVVEYSPAVIKKTVTDRGAALKGQVGFMVAKLLQLSKPPEPADAADGVAVALTHLLRTRAAPHARAARWAGG